MARHTSWEKVALTASPRRFMNSRRGPQEFISAQQPRAGGRLAFGPFEPQVLARVGLPRGLMGSRSQVRSKFPSHPVSVPECARIHVCCALLRSDCDSSQWPRFAGRGVR